MSEKISDLTAAEEHNACNENDETRGDERNQVDESLSQRDVVCPDTVATDSAHSF